MRSISATVAALGLVILIGTPTGAVAGIDEFKVKREAVFEFTKEPVVMRRGDQVTVSFETKGFCDVTVAVEVADGPSTASASSGQAGSGEPKIVRHLVSGVLGPKAPAPFHA